MFFSSSEAFQLACIGTSSWPPSPRPLYKPVASWRLYSLTPLRLAPMRLAPPDAPPAAVDVPVDDEPLSPPQAASRLPLSTMPAPDASRCRRLMPPSCIAWSILRDCFMVISPWT
jgi:hypothetical protein